jgi:uncharacterized membrane protein
MFEETELLTIIMGLVTLLLVLANYAKLKRFKAAHLIVAAFSFMFAGWVWTLIEGLGLFSLFNAFEHVCYLIGAILLLFWVMNLYEEQRPSR